MIAHIQFKCKINTTEIPISSFSLRMKDNEPSYLQVVTKDTSYASFINSAIASGTAKLYVYKRVNKGSWTEIFYVTLETARYDYGPTSESITLTGHRTYDFTSSSSVDIEGDYSYISTGNNQIVRCSPVNTIYPAQRLTISAAGIDINPIAQVTMNVSVGTYTQEVSD